MRPPLPEELFEPLAERIAEVSGIRVPSSKRWLLAARVADRMRERGEADLARYVRGVLRAEGGAELGQLVEALRVGETQFYRHQGQLRAIRRVALPEIVARRVREGERRVRVWSAGCATGEEPFTLAMLLEDALPARDGWQHEILATDMSHRALEAARAGRYPHTAVHAVPAHLLRWAFERHGDEVVVRDGVRARVRFEHRNLLEETYPRGFDLVLCRNVLIYFDRATQREVLDRLSRSVVEGGYLALGYAERLDRSDGSLFPIRTEDGVLYRRPPPGEVIPVPPAREEPRPSREPERPATGLAPTPRAPGAPETTRADPVRERPAAAGPVALDGALEGPEGERRAREALAPLFARERPLLDLRGLRYADDAVARVIARAAVALEDAGHPLVIVADTPGTLRFLRRHGVVPPAVLWTHTPLEGA